MIGSIGKVLANSLDIAFNFVDSCHRHSILQAKLTAKANILYPGEQYCLKELGFAMKWFLSRFTLEQTNIMDE